MRTGSLGRLLIRALPLLVAAIWVVAGLAPTWGDEPSPARQAADPAPAEQGDLVTIGPDGAREAVFDPAPGRPSTDFANPAPTAGVPGPGIPTPGGDRVRQSWQQSVDLVAGDCPGADSDASSAPAASVVGATICLLNAERAKAGLGALTANARLARAAISHSRDMVKRVYFAHDTPNGKSVVDRLTTTRFIAPSYRWRAGENLGWGSGGNGTPRLTVRAWMGSPEHRANILNGRFRLVGIGIVPGAPVAGESQAATYTADFGARRRIGRHPRRRRR